MIQKRQRESGFYADSFGTSNCVVNMISGDMYREFMLPYDIKLSESFGLFGIHSCNWSIDPYINGFNVPVNLSHVDFGFKSDLKAVAKDFSPETRKNIFYGPENLTNKNKNEIRRDIAFIRDTLGPCDITMPDIEAGFPDEKIIEFTKTVESFN